MLSQFKNFNILDYCIIMLSFILIITTNNNIVSITCAICGILYILQAAKGNVWSYFWGIINVLIYIYISYIYSYAGDFLLNLIFELPLLLLGVYSWKKHYNEKESHVEVKHMSNRNLLLWLLCGVLLTFIIFTVMPMINNVLIMDSNPSPLIDSITTSFSIITLLLMVLRFSEQWIVWLIVDFFSVVMWMKIGDSSMVIMWSVDLIISLYGLYVWKQVIVK